MKCFNPKNVTLLLKLKWVNLHFQTLNVTGRLADHTAPPIATSSSTQALMYESFELFWDGYCVDARWVHRRIWGKSRHLTRTVGLTLSAVLQGRL